MRYENDFSDFAGVQMGIKTHKERIWRYGLDTRYMLNTWNYRERDFLLDMWVAFDISQNWSLLAGNKLNLEGNTLGIYIRKY